MNAVPAIYESAATSWVPGKGVAKHVAHRTQFYPAVLTLMEFTPTWMQPTLERFEELLTLEENWDSYGAAPPSRDAANALLDVLKSALTPHAPPPNIIPSPHGHFQAEWHENGVDLEVEVPAPTKVLVSFNAVGAAPWEDELSLDLTKLVDAVDQLGTRR